MFRSAGVAGAFALACSTLPTASHAATDADIAEIRDQIRQLKESYEARIGALEQRLKESESEAATQPPPAAVARAPSPAVFPALSGTSANSFNPAISAVLSGVYSNLSQDPTRYGLSGFGLTDDVGPGRRGLGLGESEMTLSANVDHLFAGNLTVSLTPENTVSVEEAYGLVTALPDGLVPKFGRFFSGIGYQNEQHQHAWDFYDAPLAYQAFLGGQYATDGLQVKWLAPIDQFLELGGEIGNGGSFPGGQLNRNGIGAADVFVHTGSDVGTSHSWRAGISYLAARPDGRETAQYDTLGNLARTSLTGKSRLTVADFVWKYAPNGNAQQTNFKVQAEYFWRREHGDLTYDADGALGLMHTAAYSSAQSGGYLQGVWQFMPMWRIGARYDRLSPGSPDFGANDAFLGVPDFHPQRYTFMVDWTPSEFSRVRLQYAQNRIRPDVTDNEWFLQYILTLGAHGAHRF